MPQSEQVNTRGVEGHAGSYVGSRVEQRGCFPDRHSRHSQALRGVKHTAAQRLLLSAACPCTIHTGPASYCAAAGNTPAAAAAAATHAAGLCTMWVRTNETSACVHSFTCWEVLWWVWLGCFPCAHHALPGVLKSRMPQSHTRRWETDMFTKLL